MSTKNQTQQGLARWANGPVRSVWLATDVRDMLCNMSAGEKAKLDGSIRMYCNDPDGVEHLISMNIFKQEGKHRAEGGKLIQVSCFSIKQFRIYGHVMQYQGKEAFVGVEWDKKKQKKADQGLLQATARKIGELKKGGR